MNMTQCAKMEINGGVPICQCKTPPPCVNFVFPERSDPGSDTFSSFRALPAQPPALLEKARTGLSRVVGSPEWKKNTGFTTKSSLRILIIAEIVYFMLTR